MKLSRLLCWLGFHAMAPRLMFGTLEACRRCGLLRDRIA